MNFTPQNDPISLEEYFRREEKSEIKHEYVRGEVYAMSGVTRRHNRITLNIARALETIVRHRKGCEVFASDVKVRTPDDRVYYPDAMVTYGAGGADDLVVTDPSILVEVTSPSTRATDRREKLDAYTRIPSAEIYLIVDQRRRYVLAYTRNGERWRRDEFVQTGTIDLPAFAGTLSLDQVYDGVTLPPMTVGERELDWGEEEWNDEEWSDA